MKSTNFIAVILLLLLLTGCSLPVEAFFNRPEEIATLNTPGWDEELLTGEEAKQIALQHAKMKEEDVVDIYVSFEYDDGRPEYEVQFRSPYFFHEYEIHGLSGRIISCEREK